MLCAHCHSYEMSPSWEEPDGLMLPHCICGYVGYTMTRPVCGPESAPTSPLKSRTYGRACCAICGDRFDKRSPTHTACGPTCAALRHKAGGH